MLRNKNTYYYIIMYNIKYQTLCTTRRAACYNLQAYKSRINHTYLSTICKVLITKSRKCMIYGNRNQIRK